MKNQGSVSSYLEEEKKPETSYLMHRFLSDDEKLNVKNDTSKVKDKIDVDDDDEKEEESEENIIPVHVEEKNEKEEASLAEPVNLTIETVDDENEQNIQVTVDGSSKTKIISLDNEDESTLLNYSPKEPREYRIFVKQGHKDEKERTFSNEIKAKGHEVNCISHDFVNDTFDNLTTKYIFSPHKDEFYNMKTWTCIPIDVISECEDENLANFHVPNNHVPCDPLIMNVFNGQFCDPLKVHVTGNTKTGKTFTKNQLIIRTKDAGYGQLNIYIDGPSKAIIRAKELDEDTLNVTYKVEKAGFYIINIKFADENVPGSPFIVNVIEKKLKIEHSKDEIYYFKSECYLKFEMKCKLFNLLFVYYFIIILFFFSFRFSSI